MISPLLMKTPKSQPSTKKNAGTYQKDIIHPKQQPLWDGRRNEITIKSNLMPAGWATHTLENHYATEVLPQE